MNNWIKISDEEFDIEMSIAKLKKGELQIKYAKDISKLRNIIKEVREYIEKCKEDNWNIDLNDLLEMLKGSDKE